MLAAWRGRRRARRGRASEPWPRRWSSGRTPSGENCRTRSRAALDASSTCSYVADEDAVHPRPRRRDRARRGRRARASSRAMPRDVVPLVSERDAMDLGDRQASRPRGRRGSRCRGERRRAPRAGPGTVGLEQVAARAASSSSSSAKIGGASGRARPPACATRPRATRAARDSAARVGRCAGRRAAARRCRSSGSPRAGTRRRSGRRAGSGRGASPGRRRSRCRRRGRRGGRGSGGACRLRRLRARRARSRARAASAPGLPSPKGASRASSAQRSSESGSSRATTASIGVTGSRSSSSSSAVGVRGEGLRRTPRRSPGAIERPAAARWPPHRPSRSGARAERGVEVEGGDRAAGALPVAVGARDEDDRAVVALDEARGDDADHALVPVRAGDGVGAPARVAPAARPRPGRRPRAGSALRPPGARGSAPRASRRAAAPRLVLGEQELERLARVAEASGGVEARREPEADGACVDGGRIDAGASHERAQPGLRRARERAEPGDRERAVLVDERDDVGDRRERDEVEVALAELGVDAEQRLAELVDDAGAAELRERVVATGACATIGQSGASRRAGDGR